MTKEIQLTQGRVAIVDDWRFDELSQYKWYAKWCEHTHSFYAARNSTDSAGKRTTVFMHVVIAETPKKFQTDHINHNTLDNQEENLRVCTQSQNQHNRWKYASNTSGFKGVVRHGRGWHAQIMVGGKQESLKTRNTREEAAADYDEAAKRMHGEFAVLNFKERTTG